MILEKVELRDRILDAAEVVIREKGLSGASVDAIILEARTSKGGFFHHFASKNAMILALVNRSLARFTVLVQHNAAFLPNMPAKMLKAHILTWMREESHSHPEDIAFFAELRDEGIRRCIADHLKRHYDLVRPPDLPQAMFEVVMLSCDAIGINTYIQGLSPEKSLAYRQRITQELFRLIDQSLGVAGESVVPNLNDAECAPDKE